MTNPNRVMVQIGDIQIGHPTGEIASHDFAIDPARTTCNVGRVLAERESCKIAITFSPSSRGQIGGFLLLTGYRTQIAGTVSLRGQGY
jgi:hypothetical protein